MTYNFAYDARNAKIQGLSVQVGELFADIYKEGNHCDGHRSKSLDVQARRALESYKYLRRLLPREDNGYGKRHIGATAAHNATQGIV